MSGKEAQEMFSDNFQGTDLPKSVDDGVPHLEASFSAVQSSSSFIKNNGHEEINISDWIESHSRNFG